jgi:hypothetical protein
MVCEDVETDKGVDNSLRKYKRSVPLTVSPTSCARCSLGKTLYYNPAKEEEKNHHPCHLSPLFPCRDTRICPCKGYCPAVSRSAFVIILAKKPSIPVTNSNTAVLQMHSAAQNRSTDKITPEQEKEDYADNKYPTLPRRRFVPVSKFYGHPIVRGAMVPVMISADAKEDE